MLRIKQAGAPYLWLSIGIVGACSSPDTATVAPAPTSSTVNKSSVTTSTNYSLLKDIKTTHRFSSTATTDQFRLQLRGASVLDGTVYFSIVSPTGDTLWSEKFPATALYTDDELGTPEGAQEAYILKRIESFFAEENFRSMAVAKEAAFDAELNDNQQVWAEVKKQTVPGFEYLLGDENGRVLAYSTKHKKAMVVESCC